MEGAENALLILKGRLFVVHSNLTACSLSVE